jgi:tetratricopeptide (TPR) repeat protein
MDTSFVSMVSKALELVRKRDILTLGKQELAYLPIVQQEIPPAATPLDTGQAIASMLDSILEESMRPPEPANLDRVDWRRYVVVREYVFEGRTMGQVMDDLAMKDALFYQTKREAVEAIASHLWAANQAAVQAAQSMHRNIPQPKFDFIPRLDDEGNDYVEAILDGLKKRPWVVSIRGFGGVGKTTLAIEAAWAAASRRLFDKVIWVRIDPQRALSPDLLSHVLGTIGKEIGARNVLTMDDVDERRETIIDALSQTKSLVVFDSTEDVTDDDYAPILSLVRDFPLSTSTLLVSREMQRKTELERMIHLEGMRRNEALEFLKARALEHNLRLDQDQATYLYTKTRANPTAMLLCIGLMKKYGLPAEDILSPDIPEMPDLLNDLLGRVYGKLHTDEERVLNALTLFANPAAWPPIAAASGLSEEPARAKIALGNLHSRFLVDSTTRDRQRVYSILPLTRMFLLDRADTRGAEIAKLSANEFRAEANNRLVLHCIEAFRAAEPYERLKYVRAYKESIIRELEWCRDHGRHDLLTDLFYYTGRALGDLGYWLDRLRWGLEAAKAAGKDGRIERAAWHKIYDLAWIHMQRGEPDIARDITYQALSEFEPADFPEAFCVAHRNLGVIASVDGDYDKAVEHLEKSLSVQEPQETTEYSAMAKGALGLVKLRQRDIDRAQELFEEAHAVYVSLENPTFISLSLTDLAQTSLARGDSEGAIRLLGRSIAIANDIPDPSRARAYALRLRGRIAQEQGRPDEALECFEQSLNIYSRLGQALRIRETQRLMDELRSEVERRSNDTE